ncbi:MAG TPA: MlaD family protein [Phycisphaerae bacterium]|nr:MlaD family protein [Phycisphaerae bacterium]
MSGDSKFFKLGLFVIVGIALLVAGVVIFGAGAYFTEYVNVETATTESVEGLDVGSAVKLNGVIIGKVSKIQLAIWRYRTDDPAKLTEYSKYTVLELAIRRDMMVATTRERIKANLTAAINKGLRARITSSGLTGPTYVAAVYLSPDQYPATLPPWKPDNLYIPCVPGTMTEIVSSVEALLQEVKKANIPKMAADADKLINDSDTAVINLKTAELRDKAVALLDEAKAATTAAKNVLENPSINKAINDLADTVASAKGTVTGDEFKTFVADLPKISGRLRTTMERIDQIVHDPKVQQMVDGLSQTATNAGPASADLRRTMRELNVLLASEGEDLEAIIVGLRQLSENGAAVTDDAKSNPSRLLFGDPPPHLQNGGR